MTAAIHNRNRNCRQNNVRRRPNNQRHRSNTNRMMIGSLTKFAIALMVVAAAVCIILFSNRNVTNASESGNKVQLTKYYKTITIHQGDTLWSIAKEYKSGDYKTVNDYVEELRSMNDLHSDNILAGQKLVVAYFVDE